MSSELPVALASCTIQTDTMAKLNGTFKQMRNIVARNEARRYAFFNF